MERLPEKNGIVNPVRKRYASGATSVACSDFSLTGSILPCVILPGADQPFRITQGEPKTALPHQKTSQKALNTGWHPRESICSVDHE